MGADQTLLGGKGAAGVGLVAQLDAQAAGGAKCTAALTSRKHLMEWGGGQGTRGGGGAIL